MQICYQICTKDREKFEYGTTITYEHILKFGVRNKCQKVNLFDHGDTIPKKEACRLAPTGGQAFGGNMARLLTDSDRISAGVRRNMGRHQRVPFRHISHGSITCWPIVGGGILAKKQKSGKTHGYPAATVPNGRISFGVSLTEFIRVVMASMMMMGDDIFLMYAFRAHVTP